MAIGKLGIGISPMTISIDIGGHAVARAGMRIPDYDEIPIAKHMTGQMIDIKVTVGTGDGAARCGLVTLPTAISQSMPIIEAEPKMLLVSAVALIDITDGSSLPKGLLANLWLVYGNFRVGKSKLAKHQKQLIRELREELNIDTTLSCLAPLNFVSHHYDASDDQEAFHLLMMLFVCRRWHGRPRPMEGGTLKWVHPQNLRDYPMPAADIPLISALQDFYKLLSGVIS